MVLSYFSVKGFLTMNKSFEELFLLNYLFIAQVILKYKPFPGKGEWEDKNSLLLQEGEQPEC